MNLTERNLRTAAHAIRKYIIKERKEATNTVLFKKSESKKDKPLYNKIICGKFSKQELDILLEDALRETDCYYLSLLSKPVPYIKDIMSDLRALKKSFNIVEFASGTLRVTTHDINLEGAELGKFCIPLPQYMVNNQLVIAHSLKTKDGYPHPHVSESGIVCMGEGLMPATWAIMSGRIFDYFSIVYGVLNNYEEDDCYELIGYFLNDPCEDCGIHTYDLEICTSCDTQYCSDCVNYCACDNAVCYTCEVNCTICSEILCRMCNAAKCANCNGPLCEDCKRECCNVFCDECSAECNYCGKVICDSCENHCDCNETVCNDCITKCEDCGSK